MSPSAPNTFSVPHLSQSHRDGWTAEHLPGLHAQPWWQHLKPWHTNAGLLALGFLLICVTKQMIGENDHFTIGFSGASSLSVFIYLAALLVFLLKPSNVDRYTFSIILGIGIACRLVTLFPEPFLSSDIYRYAWDGVVQHAHVNPYRYVPGDPALTALRAPNQDLFDNMNRRDYAHTIYPPVAQIVFYLATFLNGSVTMMKMAMILFEGLSMTGLVLLLRRLSMRREWTLLYFWFPMILWEIGGSGHVDSVVIAFVTLALLFRYRRNPALTGLFLGLAVFTKFYPIVLFPALYMKRRDGRLDWKMPAALVAVGLVTYPLYLSVGKGVFGFFGGYVQEEGMETGTRYFLEEAAQKLPGLHHLPNAAFLLFCAAAMGSLALWAWRRASSWQSAPDAFLWPAMALATTLMLLFSPHYPWYIAWLVPFFVLRPNLTVLTYCAYLFYLCTTALAVGNGPKQFQLNTYLYTAVFVAFVTDMLLRRLAGTRAWFAPPRPLAPEVR